MNTYTATPDYYRDYIQHFNSNHDPRNGQFSSGGGGAPVIKSRRARRRLEKAQEKDKKLTSKAEKYLTEDILRSRKKAKFVKAVKANPDGTVSSYLVPSPDNKLKIRRRTNKAAMKSAKYYSKMTKKYGEGWRNY